jgi:hypothetical protein
MLLEPGTLVAYRGRPHVVVGVTPMSIIPHAVELEDVSSGRISSVDVSDRQLQIDRRDDRAFEPAPEER